MVILSAGGLFSERFVMILMRHDHGINNARVQVASTSALLLFVCAMPVFPSESMISEQRSCVVVHDLLGFCFLSFWCPSEGHRCTVPGVSLDKAGGLSALFSRRLLAFAWASLQVQGPMLGGFCRRHKPTAALTCAPLQSYAGWGQHWHLAVSLGQIVCTSALGACRARLAGR